MPTAPSDRMLMSAGFRLIGIGEPTPEVAVPTNQASVAPPLLPGPGAAAAGPAPVPTTIAVANVARMNRFNWCKSVPRCCHTWVAFFFDRAEISAPAQVTDPAQ